MASLTTIVVTCSCGRTFHAPDAAAGRRVCCPSCAKAVRVPIPSVETSEVDLSGSGIRADVPPDRSRTAPGGGETAAEPAPGPAAPAPIGLREYKVLGRPDEWSSAGRFRPEGLERALNRHAAQGWTLHSVLSIRADGPGPGGGSIVAILERPA